MGTFSAPDEKEAKEKLFSHGYSIIQLKEIAVNDSRPDSDFFSHPSYPEEEREKRRGQTSLRESEAPREPGSPEQKKGIAALILLCLLLAVLGLAVFAAMRPKEEAAALSPQQVVRSYLTLGFRENWTLQYPLLGGERHERSITAENYAQQMSRNWLGLPLQPAAAETAEAGKEEVPPIEISLLKKYGPHAEVSANVLVNNDKRRFVFLLHFDGDAWRIHYIRDLGKTEAHVRFLSLNPQGPRREAVLNEMQLDFGFSAEEISDLVKFFHLKNEEKKLQASITKNAEEAPAAPENASPEAKYEDPYQTEDSAEVSVEAYEVENHLMSLMNMVDSMEKESKER